MSPISLLSFIVTDAIFGIVRLIVTLSVFHKLQLVIFLGEMESESFNRK